MTTHGQVAGSMRKAVENLREANAGLAKQLAEAKAATASLEDNADVWEQRALKAEAEVARLRDDLMRAAVVMGSPKDADRLAESLGYVLASYRQRGEAAEAEVERLRVHEAASAQFLAERDGLRKELEKVMAEVARLRRALLIQRGMSVPLSAEAIDELLAPEVK